MDRPPILGRVGTDEDGDAVADATMTQLWRTTLEVLDSDGIPVQQRAFLSLAKLVGLLDDTALIAVPNDFTKDIVETRLRERVTATLGTQLGRDVRLAVTVDPSLAEAPALDLDEQRPPAPRRQRQGQGRGHGGLARAALPGDDVQPGVRQVHDPRLRAGVAPGRPIGVRR